MAWQDVANQRLGRQAAQTIADLTAVNPNVDWTAQINATADALQARYADGGWQDPNRGAQPAITAQILDFYRNANPDQAATIAPHVDQFQQAGFQRDQAIQQEQGTHGHHGLGGLGILGLGLGLGALALGQPEFLAMEGMSGAAEGMAIEGAMGMGGATAGAWGGAEALGAGAAALGGEGTLLADAGTSVLDAGGELSGVEAINAAALAPGAAVADAAALSPGAAVADTVGTVADLGGAQVTGDIAVDAATTGAETFSGSAGGTGLSPDLGYSPGLTGDMSTDFGAPEASTTTSTPMPSTPSTPNRRTGMQSAVDQLMRYGPLGLQALNMARNSGQTQRYSREIAAVGGPQRDIANQMIADAQAGRINPADQYAIDQWKQGAIAKARQYYARAGLSDSSMATNAEADIAARAAAMVETARQTMLTTGLNALNVVDRYQVAAIQAEMAGDAATAQQATNFLSAYGQWLRTLPTMTGQPGTGTTPAATGTAGTTPAP